MNNELAAILLQLTKIVQHEIEYRAQRDPLPDAGKTNDNLKNLEDIKRHLSNLTTIP